MHNVVWTVLHVPVLRTYDMQINHTIWNLKGIVHQQILIVA